MTQPASARTPPLLSAILWALPPLAIVAIYLIANAPVEARLGVVQKIFYFHVPVANAMYVGFFTCAVCSAVYLWRRDDRWDAVAVAAGEVGMMCCFAVLVTGPLWGRKSWGVYWTWDPRLTSTLLAAMIFFAYLVLRSLGNVGEVEKRFAAGLAILGALDLPVIKYSVQRWRGTHPTVITSKGGGIHPDMVPPLIASLILILLLTVALIWVRARAERLRQELGALEMEAAELGLLEEAA